VRCNRESSWHWPMQTGRPFHKFKMLKMKKVGRDQEMKLAMLWCSHIAIPLISRNVACRCGHARRRRGLGALRRLSDSITSLAENTPIKSSVTERRLRSRLTVMGGNDDPPRHQ
jgi:hypothetical protein